MPRLPTLNGDDGIWGEVLNEYLSVSHDTVGAIKPGVITNDSIATGAAIVQSKIQNLTSDLATKANITSLAPVATSGSYNDLTNTPTLFAMPSGVIVDFAGTSAPTGWLACDGSAVSRTTYAALFTSIGTTYGVGNGSTTFNLPDFRGRVSVGKAASGTFTNLNASGGAETHTLTQTEMPSHTHVQNSHTHNYNRFVPMQVLPNGYNSYASQSGWTAISGWSETGGAQPTAGTTATNQNTGGDGAHNNLQPYRVVNKIIKT